MSKQQNVSIQYSNLSLKSVQTSTSPYLYNSICLSANTSVCKYLCHICVCLPMHMSYMSVHTFALSYAFLFMCISICIMVCPYVSMSICVSVNIYGMSICMYVLMHVWTNIYMDIIQMDIHTFICKTAHMWVRPYACMDMHIYIYIYMDIIQMDIHTFICKTAHMCVWTYARVSIHVFPYDCLYIWISENQSQRSIWHFHGA
jgi:hypothetical protein